MRFNHNYALLLIFVILFHFDCVKIVRVVFLYGIMTNYYFNTHICYILQILTICTDRERWIAFTSTDNYSAADSGKIVHFRKEA